MEVAILNDTHWGAGNDSSVFHEELSLFVSEVLLPEMKRRGIKKLVHLGDVLDRRKYVNFLTARHLRTDFVEKLQDAGIEMDVVLGNHDVFFRNTNHLSSVEEILGKYPNIRYFSEPTETEIGLYVPWICDENREVTERAIRDSSNRILLGHLELSGFDFLRGVPAASGEDPSKYSRFEMVLSGHYHHRQTKGNVYYLGAPIEFTWADHDDPKGFHILNSSTGELEFVRNPRRLFRKVYYDDLEKSMEEVVDRDLTEFQGRVVKVIVKTKENPYWFDVFMERLEGQGLARTPLVVEDHLNAGEETDEDVVQSYENTETLTIFKDHIRRIKDADGIDVQFLDKTIEELYIEAVTQS